MSLAWNLGMHILIGLLGIQHFTLTVKGVLFGALIVAATQCADLYRVYRIEQRKVMEAKAGERDKLMLGFKKNMPTLLAKTFIQNWIFYTVIVMIAAEVGRSSGYGT